MPNNEIQIVPEVIAVNLPPELRNLKESELEKKFNNLIKLKSPTARIKEAIRMVVGQSKISTINELLKQNSKFNKKFISEIEELEKDSPVAQVTKPLVLGMEFAQIIRSDELSDDSKPSVQFRC